MASIDQKKLLQDLIDCMHSEGMINAQFDELLAMKEAISPDYLLRAVTTYCISVKSLFINLTNQILQSNVDFYELNISASDLFQKTSSVGAEHVKVACAELVRASEENDLDLCFQALYWTKNEFCQLQKKFEDLVQIIVNSSCTIVLGVLTFQAKQRKTLFRSIYLLYLNPNLYMLQLTQNDLQKGLLQDYVQSLLNESLKTTDQPDYVVKLIISYFDDVEVVLNELTKHIDSPDADFKTLAAKVHEINERSLGIGAEHMKRACSDLVLACNEMHERKFSQTLDWMKIEFTRTRDKLDAFIQMEKRIIRFESKQPKRVPVKDSKVK